MERRPRPMGDDQLLARPTKEPPQRGATGADVLSADHCQVRPIDKGQRPDGQGVDGFSGHESSKEPLPAERDESLRPEGAGPAGVQLAGNRCQDYGICGLPLARQGPCRQAVACLEGHLLPSAIDRVAVGEHGAARKPNEPQLDPSPPEKLELVCVRCLVIDAHQHAHGQPQARYRHRPVGDAAAEAPAASVRRIHIATRRPHHKDGRWALRAYTRAVYFYEIHESDDELFADALLAHDSEYDEDEFLEMVVEARREVIDSFTEDSLVEAIAKQLARTHGFIHIDDSQLRAAVRVSADEDETQITPVEEIGASVGEPEEEDFRTLLVDVDPEDQPWRN